jgi:DNA repair and recombination protein RAD54B
MLRKKAQLASLGEWTHINALERSAREHVKDEVLASLLHKFTPIEDEEVSETMAESQTKSRLQNLLDVDAQKLSAMEIDSEKKPELSVRDVPGGTISFLFERLSTTIDVVEEE